jgi:hypothetical protein
MFDINEFKFKLPFYKTLNLINMENSQLLNEVKHLKKQIEQLKNENCMLKNNT